jgi:hypothetical protein
LVDFGKRRPNQLRERPAFGLAFKSTRALPSVLHNGGKGQPEKKYVRPNDFEAFSAFQSAHTNKSKDAHVRPQ